MSIIELNIRSIFDSLMIDDDFDADTGMYTTIEYDTFITFIPTATFRSGDMDVIVLFEESTYPNIYLSAIKLPSMETYVLKGLYMLATILKSEQATQTTIAIIETFARIRELMRNVVRIADAPDEQTQKQLMQRSGGIVADLLDEELQTTDTETSIELNLAVLNFKHTIKRKKE